MAQDLAASVRQLMLLNMFDASTRCSSTAISPSLHRDCLAFTFYVPICWLGVTVAATVAVVGCDNCQWL